MTATDLCGMLSLATDAGITDPVMLGGATAAFFLGSGGRDVEQLADRITAASSGFLTGLIFSADFPSTAEHILDATVVLGDQRAELLNLLHAVQAVLPDGGINEL